VLVCVVAGVRVGITAYEYRKSQITSSDALRGRFEMSSAVRQLLDRTDAAAPGMDGQFPCVFANASELKPQLGKCAMPTERSGAVDRFEADLRYGNFVLRQSDLFLNDVFDVPLTRSYNSGDYLQSNRVHAFGKNANHPFDIAPVGSRYPYTYQMLVLEDGDFLYLPRVSEGTSFSDAVYQHTETSTGFYKAVTAWNGNGWTTWRADGTAIAFPEAYNSKNAAQGAAIEMRDAKGNLLELVRDEERNLQEIRTPHNHSIKFKYDDQTRITRAEDDRGHWAEYRYDANGMLTDATSSTGHARHYAYDGDLMTEIADEKQQILLRNSYSDRALTRQDFGNGETYSYSYTGSDGPYATSATVTLPDGTETTVETAGSVPEARKHPPH
jgi:YD repeat-containing protein